MTTKFPTIDLARFARRELMRMKRDYPRMVSKAVLPRAQADTEIAMQTELVELLETWVRTHNA